MESFSTPGWNAITQALTTCYPDQMHPVHYAPMIHYQLGGNDPLDGISIYDGGAFYHFVTYGFSELYEKESDCFEWSGLGFELTIRLRKAGIRKRDREHKNICGILQSLARLSFEQGDLFGPQEYIYTGQTTGIDADGTSPLTGFLTMADPLGTIDTPNGKLQFVQLVGATDAELQAIINNQTTVCQLLQQIPHGWTDYTRTSIF